MTAPAAGVGTTFDLNAFLASILAQHGGDKDAAIKQLGSELKKTRDKIRGFKERAEKAEAVIGGQKDAVILTGDDAKEYKDFKELGIKVKDAKEALAEVPTLRAFKVNTERAEASTKAVKLLEWRQSTVLLDQINSRGLDLSFKKVKIKDSDGNEEEKELPHVRKQGDDKTQWVTLSDEYVAEQWGKPYLTALKASDDASESDEEAHLTTFPVGPGPSQKSGKAQSRDLVGDHLTKTFGSPFASQANTDKK